MKKWVIFSAALAITASSVASVFAADHIDAPVAVAHPGTDITDLYAFVKGDKLVMAMTFNPFLSADAPYFDRDARYYFHVDTNGDAATDLFLRVDFGPTGQHYLSGSLRRFKLDFFAGRREDPFFFDLGLLGDGLSGGDTFAGANVGAIVVAIDVDKVTPNGSNIGVWATTSRQGTGDVDRMGRPVINTLFIPEGMKDDYNRDDPRRDARRYSEFVPLPDILLPDILTIDTAAPTAYPNGRALEDDVIDISLGLVFGEGTDEVNANDVSFLDEFPYLAPPHVAAKAVGDASEPAGFALGRAHPNPFNPETEIPYSLAAGGHVSIKVYNMIGQEIRSLVNAAQPSGFHAVSWDGMDNQGREAASGIYLYRLQLTEPSGQAGLSISRQMTLLR
jgi:hypothetical protein